MGLVIALIYIVGILAAVGVGRHRVGMSQMGRLDAKLVFLSLPWFLSSLVVIMFWPVALVVWLARGKQDTPWELLEARDGTLMVKRRTYSDPAG
jgi:hypothetical protein